MAGLNHAVALHIERYIGPRAVVASVPLLPYQVFVDLIRPRILNSVPDHVHRIRFVQHPGVYFLGVLIQAHVVRGQVDGLLLGTVHDVIPNLLALVQLVDFLERVIRHGR